MKPSKESTRRSPGGFLGIIDVLLLMAEIRGSPVEVVFPIIYKVSYIPGGAGFQPSTVVPGHLL